MRWLNYHHLMYFWMVAREGSVAKACRRLHLAQPTISGQLRELELSLGVKLFDRVGRNLALSEAGKDVFRYADEIFALGRDLQDMLDGRPVGKPLRFVVGVAEAVPKLLTYRILEPVFQLTEPIQVVCHEGPTDELLSQLAQNELDMVLSDAPVGPSAKIRAFNHLLGECGVSFCAAAKVAAKLRRGFPQSLDNSAFLLPMEGTSLRRSLDHWFEEKAIRPRIRGEFADSSLRHTFARAGLGIVAVPTAVETEVQRGFHLRLIDRIDSIQERFYVISPERKLKHPAVAAITERAREKLFG